MEKLKKINFYGYLLNDFRFILFFRDKFNDPPWAILNFKVKEFRNSKFLI